MALFLNDMKFQFDFKDQAFVSVSRLIAAFISGIFWFYLAAFLDKDEYGELGYLISIAGVASGVSILGLNQIIVVYGPKNENI